MIIGYKIHHTLFQRKMLKALEGNWKAISYNWHVAVPLPPQSLPPPTLKQNPFSAPPFINFATHGRCIIIPTQWDKILVVRWHVKVTHYLLLFPFPSKARQSIIQNSPVTYFFALFMGMPPMQRSNLSELINTPSSSFYPFSVRRELAMARSVKKVLVDVATKAEVPALPR